MRTLLALLPLTLTAATPFQATFEANSKQWEAIHGSASPDSQVQRARHNSLRVEAAGDSGAFIRSTPVNLTVG
ncbi:MAG TPA: hypothetical protein VKS01_00445, partial [Bryobacteraceae bacterium]|nr:hypothetical protein [Bryobacteraceae bacterium]